MWEINFRSWDEINSRSYLKLMHGLCSSRTTKSIQQDNTFRSLHLRTCKVHSSACVVKSIAQCQINVKRKRISILAAKSILAGMRRAYQLPPAGIDYTVCKLRRPPTELIRLVQLRRLAKIDFSMCRPVRVDLRLRELIVI